MIKPYPLSKMMQETEFVPQAIVAVSVADLAKRFGSSIESGEDDFDQYDGAGAWLDELAMRFALMHYRGHPPRTTTIYLPFEIDDVKKITDIISRITKELDVTSQLLWERKDGPDMVKPPKENL